MVDEYKLAQNVTDSVTVSAWLENGLFERGQAALEAELIKAWKATDVRDNDARERIWTAVQQVGKLKEYFAAILMDGKLAEKHLQMLAENRERAIRFGNAA